MFKFLAAKLRDGCQRSQGRKSAQLIPYGQQLAYVIITPTRCISPGWWDSSAPDNAHRSGNGAARMFAPSAELVQKYSDVIISTADPQDRRIRS